MAKKKFRLEVKQSRRSLKKSFDKAKAAVNAGEKAVARARKTGDADLIKANSDALRDNKKTVESLEASLKALSGAPCVDQFLNSDPTYQS